jgi:predicted nucleotidyltransferase
MGRTFENENQFFDTLKVLRKERKNGALKVGIFGSRARGDHRPTSDIDILSEIDDPAILGLEQTRSGEIHLISIRPDNNNTGASLIRRTTKWLWRKRPCPDQVGE